MEYWEINRCEVLIHDTTWLDGENIVIFKKPVQKTTYCVIPLI